MKNKVIWITGGSSGIGKALAYKFANEGWQVALSARREELLNEISKSNNEIRAKFDKVKILLKLTNLSVNIKVSDVKLMYNNREIQLKDISTNLSIRKFLNKMLIKLILKYKKKFILMSLQRQLGCHQL